MTIGSRLLESKWDWFLEYKWVALTVTTLGIFMVGLDARIVIIGLPQVASQLKADAEQAIWITQAYAVATTVLLPLIGRLSDIFGRVKIYAYGFAIFTVGSALTSLGMDPYQVIIFRALQGLGAALVYVNSVAIVTDSTPRNELGLFVGINQIAYRAGALLGLTISGIILAFLDWRALFYVNIPVGIFGTFWARRRLKETAVRDKNARIDYAGFLLFFTFLLSLMLALTFSAYGASRLTTLIYGLFAVSALSFVGFALRERSIDYPLVNFQMFRIREVTGGVLAVLFNVISWATVLLLLSLQFQLIVGLSPLEAGLRILPFELAFLAVGPLSGTLSDRFGHVKFTVSGLFVGSIALFLFSTITLDTSFTVLSVYMVLLGIGTGLFLAPNLRGVMGAVPQKGRGVGSAMVSLFLNIGLAVSLNFAIVIMSSTAPYSLITRVISSINPVSISGADRLIFLESIKNTFLAAAIINAIAIIPSILQIRRKPSRQKTEASKTGVKSTT